MKEQKIPISKEDKAKIIKIIDSIGSKGFNILKANMEFEGIFLKAKSKNQ